MKNNANPYSINLKDFHLEFVMLSTKDNPLKFSIIANCHNVLYERELSEPVEKVAKKNNISVNYQKFLEYGYFMPPNEKGKAYFLFPDCEISPDEGGSYWGFLALKLRVFEREDFDSIKPFLKYQADTYFTKNRDEFIDLLNSRINKERKIIFKGRKNIIDEINDWINTDKSKLNKNRSICYYFNLKSKGSTKRNGQIADLLADLKDIESETKFVKKGTTLPQFKNIFRNHKNMDIPIIWTGALSELRELFILLEKNLIKKNNNKNKVLCHLFKHHEKGVLKPKNINDAGKPTKDKQQKLNRIIEDMENYTP